MSEKLLQNKILSWLREFKKSNKIYYEKRYPSGLAYKKGLPDLYVVYKGLHLEFELKSPDGELSSMQEIYQDLFNDIAVYYVITSLKQFTDIILALQRSEVTISIK